MEPLEQLWTPELCRAHNAKGDRLRARINEVSQAHGAPCQAYGNGSLVNVIFRSVPLFGDDGISIGKHSYTSCKAHLNLPRSLPESLLAGTAGDWKEEGLSAAMASSLFFFSSE